MEQPTIYAIGDLHGDIHALRILLEDCAQVINPFDDIQWNILFSRTYQYRDINLDSSFESVDDLLKPNKIKIKVINDFPSWNPNRQNVYIVVTGDMIDNHRPNYTVTEEGCHIGAIKQEELKILLCLKILDYQARKYNSRVITLIGNHEHMNFDYEDIAKEYMCHPYHHYFDLGKYIYDVNDTKLSGNISRFKFFKTFRKLFYVDGQIKIIYRVNNCIFMHGGLTEKHVKMYKTDTYTNIDHFIDAINNAYNEMYGDTHDDNKKTKILLNDILYNRDIGEFNDKDHCQIIKSVLSELGVKDHMVVVGHCVQTLFNLPALRITRKFIRYFHGNVARSGIAHIIDGDTVEYDLLEQMHLLNKKFVDHDENLQLIKEQIYFPKFIGITTTKCDGQNKIYRLDVAMSKAFDGIGIYDAFDNFYKNFNVFYRNMTTDYQPDDIKRIVLKYQNLTSSKEFSPFNIAELHKTFQHYAKELFILFIKHILSRSPQTLKIDENTGIIRASLFTTLKKMNRLKSLIPKTSDPVSNLFCCVVSYIDNYNFKKNELCEI